MFFSLLGSLIIDQPSYINKFHRSDIKLENIYLSASNNSWQNKNKVSIYETETTRIIRNLDYSWRRLDEVSNYLLISLNPPIFIIKLLISSISNRNFIVIVNNVMWNFFEINCGVPQGSIKPPILYNISHFPFPSILY